MKPHWNDQALKKLLTDDQRIDRKGPPCCICGKEIKPGDKYYTYQDIGASIPAHASCTGNDFAPKVMGE